MKNTENKKTFQVPVKESIFGPIILAAIIASSYGFYLMSKSLDTNPDDIIIKEAPLLAIEKVETNMGSEANYRLLKLDVNKNGVFDNEDVIVKDTNIPPLRVEKNNNIIYFENKKDNKKSILAYQDNNNNYFFNENTHSLTIRKKLDKYLLENKQR